MDKLIICSTRDSGKYTIEKRSKLDSPKWEDKHTWYGRVLYCNSKKEAEQVCKQLSTMFFMCEFRPKKNT